MASTKAYQVLLTLDDVHAWERERERLVLLIGELDRKLAAAASFLPKDSPTAVSAIKEGATDDDAAVSHRVLGALGNGRALTPAGILTAIQNEPGSTVKPTSVNRALARLARRGTVDKRGTRYRLAPPIAAPPKPVAKASRYGEAEQFRNRVLAALEDRPNGMAATDIIGLLKAEPDGERKINGNPQYPYSLLGRMVAKGTLLKVDGIYRHPNASAGTADGQSPGSGEG